MRNFGEHHQGEVRRISQPVEKVVVDPVGGPGEPENKARTLQERRIQPLVRGRRERKGVFQQAVPFPRTLCE
jgi:hypothetical protein